MVDIETNVLLLQIQKTLVELQNDSLLQKLSDFTYKSIAIKR